MKKWIENRFIGVSTKYLQKYLNWFKAKEMLKTSPDFIKDFTNSTLEDITAWKRFKAIPEEFEKLLQFETLN